jgi:hypothetical protein
VRKLSYKKIGGGRQMQKQMMLTILRKSHNSKEDVLSNAPLYPLISKHTDNIFKMQTTRNTSLIYKDKIVKLREKIKDLKQTIGKNNNMESPPRITSSNDLRSKRLLYLKQ